MRPASTTGGLS
jgi:hypothetical protein